MTRLLLLLALLCAWVTPLYAHTRSESHSTWAVDGSLVHLTFSMTDIEVKRLNPNGPLLDDNALIAYLFPRLGATAQGKACPLAVSPHAVTAATGFRRIEMIYNCASPQDIVLHDSALFDRVPTHFNMAQIQTAKMALILVAFALTMAFRRPLLRPDAAEA
ncbi:MAG: hypothetical protein KGQ42_01425 [Alphaproteobacteria bacterium]|nr:hypothetical protein [Alphaproteobacteria bacterium]MDE2042381.1 hypothetical protein [Alphaproteobacteria bacterium]MDE2340068.1 hypothetical protein [Alphaproteobacteria bacterium]